MPRISIIIAHHNDQRLEDTLLSVLENRPRDSEIIVAHDGSYSDPYDLEDEVLFVETSQGSSRASKLNEALYATCAPIVHILGEGMLVADGWCESAIHRIQRQGISAVSPLIQSRGTTSVIAGLDARLLSKRGLQVTQTTVPSRCAGPLLAAGFFSRRTLLSLGGLLETVDSRVADVDLALCFQQLGLTCDVDTQSVVLAHDNNLSTHHDAGVARDLASLLAAHQQIPSGMVAGFKGAGKRLLCNVMNPSQWAQAIAWGIGLAQNRLESQVFDRLNACSRAQVANASSVSESLSIFGNDRPTESKSVRKAA